MTLHLTSIKSGDETPVFHGIGYVYAVLRRSAEDAGGQSAWATSHAISSQYVSDVVNARRDPGPKILAALGLKSVVRYVKVK